MQLKIGFGLLFVVTVVLVIILVRTNMKKRAAEQAVKNADAKLENTVTE